MTERKEEEKGMEALACEVRRACLICFSSVGMGSRQLLVARNSSKGID